MKKYRREDNKLENKYNQAKQILEKYNQTHLLSQYEKLDNLNKEYLLNQIMDIDFNQINNLYNQIKVFEFLNHNYKN